MSQPWKLTEYEFAQKARTAHVRGDIGRVLTDYARDRFARGAEPMLIADYAARLDAARKQIARLERKLKAAVGGDPE